MNKPVADIDELGKSAAAVRARYRREDSPVPAQWN